MLLLCVKIASKKMLSFEKALKVSHIHVRTTLLNFLSAVIHRKVAFTMYTAFVYNCFKL